MSESATKTNSSATTTRATPAAAKSSSFQNLLGLWPYLKRYPGGVALGMLYLLLTSLVGNIIPLATGVITDVAAGNARPFRPPGARGRRGRSSRARKLSLVGPGSAI